MKRRSFFVLVMAALVPVLATAQSPFNATDDTAIRAGRAGFVAAVNAGDRDRIMSYAAEDCVFLAEGQPLVEGRAALGEMFRRAIESGMTWELRMETSRIEQSGWLAYELGRYWKTTRRPDGTTKQSQGKYVDVWKRQSDGRWLLIVHAPSDDPPPAPRTQ